MPPFLQAFATINPMTYMVNAIRGLLISGDLSTLPIDILAIALFDAIVFSLATWSFKKIIE